MSGPTDNPAAAPDGDHRRRVAVLLEQAAPRLHAFVRLRMGAHLRAREESVDLVQSICRAVLQEREAFDYRGERQFDAWLFKVALNKLRERGRFVGRARRSPARELPLDAESSRIYASMMTPSQAAIGSEVADRLEAAFARLPEDYREVITLARVAGLSHAEIAAVMDRTPTATRTLLGRALARLSDELEAADVRDDTPPD